MAARFGKVHERDAIHLADLIASFSGRARAAKIRIVLYCIANTYDADQPYFNVGTRKMAEFAGCARKTAVKLVEEMEAEGIIVNLGPSKTKSGTFTKRAFWWMVEGRVDPLSSPPLCTKPAVSSPRVDYLDGARESTSEARASDKAHGFSLTRSHEQSVEALEDYTSVGMPWDDAP